jgi:hypothetical protein
MPPTLNDALAMSDDVLFRELDSEAVLLNLKTGVYFGLNPVGTRAWQLFVEHHVLARVVDLMLDEFEVERDVLERDLLDLSRQLVDAGLCEVMPGVTPRQ